MLAARLELDAIVAKAISTHEGRLKLAQSMVQPLRTGVDYPPPPEPCICCGERNAKLGAKNGCDECVVRGIMES